MEIDQVRDAEGAQQPTNAMVIQKTKRRWPVGGAAHEVYDEAYDGTPHKVNTVDVPIPGKRRPLGGAAPEVYDFQPRR